MAGHMPHGFEDRLRLPDPTTAEPGEEPPGPHARGQVGEGEEFSWVQVWIIQNGPDQRTAAAYGESKDTTFTGTWDVETEMADVSESFTPGRPAEGVAMARVVYPNGETKVEWWTDPVMIDAPEKGAI
jgi:hypothetical protein